MRLTKMIVLIVLLFSAGCDMGINIVDFSDLQSYVEASLEQGDQLVFRAIIVPNSYLIINKYSFFPKGNNYYLTFQYETGDKAISPAIKYMPLWAGIKVTIPRENFNPKTDKIYYKDREGEHEIITGTKNSWKNYIEKRLKKNPNLTKEMLERALGDI